MGGIVHRLAGRTALPRSSLPLQGLLARPIERKAIRCKPQSSLDERYSLQPPQGSLRLLGLQDHSVLETSLASQRTTSVIVGWRPSGRTRNRLLPAPRQAIHQKLIDLWAWLQVRKRRGRNSSFLSLLSQLTRLVRSTSASPSVRCRWQRQPGGRRSRWPCGSPPAWPSRCP